jgi:hypothetical protein
MSDITVYPASEPKGWGAVFAVAEWVIWHQQKNW